MDRIDTYVQGQLQKPTEHDEVFLAQILRFFSLHRQDTTSLFSFV